MSRRPVPARPGQGPCLLALTLATAGVVAWPLWRLPGLPVTLMALTTAGIVHRSPALTGGTNRRPAPAGDRERTALERHRKMRLLRWVAVPRGLWPVQASLLAGAGAAICAWALPVWRGAWWLTRWGPCAQSVAAFLLVVGCERWWRMSASPEEPGPGTPVMILARRSRWMVSVVVVLALAGIVVGVLSRGLSTSPALWVAGCLLLGLAAGIWVTCRAESWRPFTVRKSERAAWRSRWAMLPKQDPAPFLIDVEEAGPFLVETFTCPPGRRPSEYLSMSETLRALVGAGREVHVLPALASDGAGRRAAGTIHPSAFVVCTADRGTTVDPSTVDDGRTVEIACARVLADAETTQIAVTGAEPLTGGTGPRVWRVLLAASKAEAAAAASTLEILGPVLVDDGTLIVGPTEGARWLDDEMARLVADLSMMAQWTAHFREVIRPSQTPPVPQVRYLDTQRVSGVDVHRLPFVSPQGMDVAAEYLPLAQRLRTTMPSAPFLTVLGMPPTEGESAPGARSDKFFCVVWTTSPVPSSPAELPPADEWGSRNPFDPRDGASLVLAGIIDEAFRSVFGSKGAPELVDAVCLTIGEPSIWRARLRLYGGVSVADLRRRSDRLGALMRAEWLRVRDAGDLVEVYAGVRPALVRVVERHRRTVAELDFEQAFVDAKLVTGFGRTPALESLSTLAGNPEVGVYDFVLPAGLSAADVVDKREKVAAGTAHAFLRVLPGGDPSRVRLLAARRNPIPDTAPYDLDAARTMVDRYGSAGRLRVPWGVGLDGAPVTWSLGATPHCLVLGPTGTGKTVVLINAVTGTLLAGWDVVVLDPVKAGADFAPLAPFLRGLVGEADEAAAVLRSVYDEVRRRKDLNARYGTASIDALPPEERPSHMLVVIDEFTSLLLPERVSRARTVDPDVLAERAAAEHLNDVKATIASLVGKIGREARSAGVHVLLGAQALRAETVKAIPGSDLKTNTGRLILGRASYGDLASGLRRPGEAPILTHAPAGRGLWEPINAAAVEVQAWHTPVELLAAELRECGVTEHEDLPLDERQASTPVTAYSEINASEPEETSTPLDLNDLGLDDLDLSGGAGDEEPSGP